MRMENLDKSNEDDDHDDDLGRAGHGLSKDYKFSSGSYVTQSLPYWPIHTPTQGYYIIYVNR